MFLLEFHIFVAKEKVLWISAMDSIVLFLLGEGFWGLRTGGPLTSCCRVWARLRMPVVRQWAAEPKEPLAAGVGQLGQSTEVPAGKVMVVAGAAEHGQEVDCAILDVGECCEHEVRSMQERALALGLWVLCAASRCVRPKHVSHGRTR